MTPDPSDAHFELGLLLWRQDRHAAAEAELRLALAADPDHAAAHAVLALGLADPGKLEPAADEAARAVRGDPAYAFGHFARAQVFYKSKRPADAEAAVREALRLDPGEAAYYALVAQLRLDRRDPAGAARAAEEGLSHDPNHAGCSALRTIALLRQGKAEAAGDESAAALRRDPEDAFAHAGRGWALLHEKRPADALTHFREALRLDPTNAWARDGLVEALKARYWLYRQMLGFFLWMGRLSSQAQWGVVIGLLVAQQVLAGVARNNPGLAPFVDPLLYGLLGFVVLTWLAAPLFNLLLRLNRFGRLVLSADERRQSTLVLCCVLVGLAGLAVSLASGGAAGLIGQTTALTCLPVLLPLSAIHRLPAGPRRYVMTAYVAGMGVVWAVMVGNFVDAGRAGTDSEMVAALRAGFDAFRVNVYAGIGGMVLANVLLSGGRR